MPHPVSLKRLLALANPVEDPPWECGILLSKDDVLEAIAAQDWLTTPVPDEEQGNPYLHARRIAFLASHGWSDPIEIDVGVPSVGCCPVWPIEDGNHRLYAAAVREDTHVDTSVSGDLNYAARLFGIRAELLEDCECD